MKALFDVTSLLTKNLTIDGIYTKNLYRLLRGLGVDVDAVYKVLRGVRDNFIEHPIGTSPKKLISLFADRVYRDQLVTLGQANTQAMTWLNCAKAVSKIYGSL